MAKPQYQMSQPKNYKLIVEKDVQIPMRDGTVLYARHLPAGRRQTRSSR